MPDLLSPLGTVATQAAAVTHVQLDLARVLIGLVAAAFAILTSIVVYFLKTILDEFRAVKVKVDELSQSVQMIRQELFGVTGQNGMRRDLRRTRELQVRHDRLLIEIAAQMGIEHELDAGEEAA